MGSFATEINSPRCSNLAGRLTFNGREKMVLYGSCLCGCVKYEISGELNSRAIPLSHVNRQKGTQCSHMSASEPTI